MLKKAPSLSFVLLLLCATASPQASDTAASLVEIDRTTLPVESKDVEGVERHLFRDGRVFIGGQPSEAALARFKDLGVTAVVNLRTQREMDNREHVPFDEEGVVATLGIEYVHIPLGGTDNPYGPAAVERFAEAVAKHNGHVLLHCTVAWRASYMWTAYLIRYVGLDLDSALARGRAMAIGTDPLEELLGRPLKLVWADAAPPS